MFRSVCPDLENLKTRVGDHWMDSAAMGSSSMKLDNKRAPYAAGPLRQASRLCIRVTPVRCLADIPEPRFWTVSEWRLSGSYWSSVGTVALYRIIIAPWPIAPGCGKSNFTASTCSPSLVQIMIGVQAFGLPWVWGERGASPTTPLAPPLGPDGIRSRGAEVPVRVVVHLRRYLSAKGGSRLDARELGVGPALLHFHG